MTQRPSIPKSTALLIMSGGSCVGLANFPTGPAHPSSVAPRAVINWWSSIGTGPAAMSVVWVIAMSLAVYMTLVGAIALAAGLAQFTGRFQMLDHAWTSITGDGLKRLLMVGAIVTWSSGPAAASTPSDPPSPLVLMDLGPAITPSADAPPADAAPPDAAPADAVWIVKPGDHLWHIAEQTIESVTGMPPDVRQVTRYWKRLIGVNFATPGSNPDLIVPGQIVTLPPV